MSPVVAVTLAYGVVWVGLLLYLRHLRRRLLRAEAQLRDHVGPAIPGESTTVR